MTELIENGKIVTTFDNGKKVESEPSAVMLNCKKVNKQRSKTFIFSITTMCQIT